MKLQLYIQKKVKKKKKMLGLSFAPLHQLNSIDVKYFELFFAQKKSSKCQIWIKLILMKGTNGSPFQFFLY